MDNMDLNERHLVYPDQRVIIEIALLYAAIPDRDLEPERRTQAVDRSAL